MRALLLAALLLPAAAARAQEDEQTPPLQRSLAGLSLGDGFEDARRAYPPAEEWPVVVRSRKGVKRYRVERTAAKSFPAKIELLFLGVKNGRLVEIQAVYDKEQSRLQNVEKMAGELALVYGTPRRSDGAFWWSDRRTVLRALVYEMPLAKDSPQAVEWRASIQVFEKGTF